ncbi:hypothetical protein F53441_7176 [Fusarium austroafricanum]|uniref:Uncharacterized protein n=1 Tax=Fusarium austroafricanum TaxID=2364996 RepID=A0A8H4NSJ4_9HYPO|nr:hypothetical protein F53441_7176 [Fusarium austroafricanum]
MTEPQPRRASSPTDYASFNAKRSRLVEATQIAQQDNGSRLGLLMYSSSPYEFAALIAENLESSNQGRADVREQRRDYCLVVQPASEKHGIEHMLNDDSNDMQLSGKRKPVNLRVLASPIPHEAFSSVYPRVDSADSSHVIGIISSIDDANAASAESPNLRLRVGQGEARLTATPSWNHYDPEKLVPFSAGLTCAYKVAQAFPSSWRSEMLQSLRAPFALVSRAADKGMYQYQLIEDRKKDGLDCIAPFSY